MRLCIEDGWPFLLTQFCARWGFEFVHQHVQIMFIVDRHFGDFWRQAVQPVAEPSHSFLLSHPARRLAVRLVGNYKNKDAEVPRRRHHQGFQVIPHAFKIFLNRVVLPAVCTRFWRTIWLKLFQLRHDGKTIGRLKITAMVVSFGSQYPAQAVIYLLSVGTRYRLSVW